jgi:hypothetical protein
MTSEEIASSARYLDSQTETRGGDEVLKELGIDWDSLRYVANQRAIRLMLVLSGKKLPTSMKHVKLTAIEEAVVDHLSMASMDGICIGIAAAKGLSEPRQEVRSLN